MWIRKITEGVAHAYCLEMLRNIYKDGEENIDEV